MYYQANRETGKLELIFDKSEYLALSDEQKREIKGNFLFSRSIGGWVSRCKFPNLYRAEEIARKLGAENRGKTGEALTFAEQQERKAERAEARAERMDGRSGRAAAEAERLQKPINDMHGDIAFFTQPNVNTSAGRAFTNRRNKMFAAYERGFEEFKKSEYYAERAEIARRTAAEATAPTDKGFCERRIADAEKTIRAQQRNLAEYREALDKLNGGEEMPYYYRDTPHEKLENWIEQTEEIIENAISKAIYYREALEALGGVQFSRENVKPGYLVELSKSWKGVVKVVSCGPKNITYTDADDAPPPHFYLKASYGEIKRIVKAEPEQVERHPFKVGDTFTVELWNSDTCKREKTPVEIVKATDKSVTVKNLNSGKTCVRKPQKRDANCKDGAVWAFFLNADYYSGCFKPVSA